MNINNSYKVLKHSFCYRCKIDLHVNNVSFNEDHKITMHDLMEMVCGVINKFILIDLWY